MPLKKEASIAVPKLEVYARTVYLHLETERLLRQGITFIHGYILLSLDTMRTFPYAQKYVLLDKTKSEGDHIHYLS